MKRSPSTEGDPLTDIARAIGTTDTLDRLLAAILMEASNNHSISRKRETERGGEEIGLDLVNAVFGRLEQAGTIRES